MNISKFNGTLATKWLLVGYAIGLSSWKSIFIGTLFGILFFKELKQTKDD